MTYRSGYWSTPGIRTVAVMVDSGDVESVMSTSRSVYNLYLRLKGKIVSSTYAYLHEIGMNMSRVIYLFFKERFLKLKFENASFFRFEANMSGK